MMTSLTSASSFPAFLAFGAIKKLLYVHLGKQKIREHESIKFRSRRFFFDGEKCYNKRKE